MPGAHRRRRGRMPRRASCWRRRALRSTPRPLADVAFASRAASSARPLHRRPPRSPSGAGPATSRCMSRGRPQPLRPRPDQHLLRRPSDRRTPALPAGRPGHGGPGGRRAAEHRLRHGPRADPGYPPFRAGFGLRVCRVDRQHRQADRRLGARCGQRRRHAADGRARRGQRGSAAAPGPSSRSSRPTHRRCATRTKTWAT